MFSMKDFFAGWGAGVCGLLIGHPADTIKVRQQVSKGRSIFEVFITTVKNEGIRGLYRGMLFPLLLAGIQNSLFFGVYGNTLRILQSLDGGDINRRTCGQGSIPNKHWHLNVYLAGFTGGFFHAFIGCPVELIKIKMQATSSSEEHMNNRLKDCIRNIYNRSGTLGFYQGYIATLCRDVPICGMYVLVYEHLLTVGASNDRTSQPTLLREIIAGGLSGTITWVVVTPLDVVKSRMQADDISNPKYKGIIDCVIKSYKEEGLRVFGRGFLVLGIRGFPVNAATFVGYEWFLKMYSIFEH